MLLILDSAIIVCETNHELKCLKSEALILPSLSYPILKDTCGEGPLRGRTPVRKDPFGIRTRDLVLTYCHLYVGRSLDSDSA